MRIDDLDIAIFNLLQNNRHLTSTTMAKKIFKPKNAQELTTYNSKIYYRLSRWVEFDVLKKKRRHGKEYYFINPIRILYGSSRVLFKSFDKKQKNVSLSFNKTFILIEKDKYFIIAFQPV